MEEFDGEYQELTADEQSARRVLTLAIALINARRPLSSSEIYRDLYSDMSQQTFRRTFLRDRGRLVVAGLVMRQAGSDGDEALWEIDGNASFTRDNQLTQEDALLLDFLLIPKAADPSFPFARDLRIALTKIDRSFDGSNIAHIPAGARKRSNNLTKVEDCLAARRGMRMTYTRANDTQLTRNVVPLGLFSLNDNTYLVAAPSDTCDGMEAEPHTYNLSRIQTVRELPTVSFDIPDDFDVRDYIKLPFQIGPAEYTATFVDETGGHTRHEDVHDTRIAAAWALAEGLRPTEPDSLVDAWREQVDHMQDWLSRHGTDAVHAKSKRPRKPIKTKVGRGRKGGVETIRELVSLLGSLCHTGDTVSLDAISSRLGISVDEAQRLMDIVCQASGEHTCGLLISCNDDESEYTLQYPGVRGKPIRLTPQETIAVIHALDDAGISDDDPLRTRLSQTFSSYEIQTEEVRQSLGTSHEAGPLPLCAQSQAERRVMHFMYKGAHDKAPRPRRALVRGLRPQGNIWLVSCYDMDLGQERTFRADRMTDVNLEEEAVLGRITPSDQRSIGVTFTDKMYYQCFDWPDLHILQNNTHAIQGDILYYGPSSTWLPRRIIACNGTMELYDRELLDETKAYLSTLR